MKVLAFPRALRAAEAGALSQLNLAPSSCSERYFFSNDQRTAALRAQSAPRCARTAQRRAAPRRAAPPRAARGQGWPLRGGGAAAAEPVRRSARGGGRARARRVPGRDRARGRLPPRGAGGRRAPPAPSCGEVCNLGAAAVLAGAGGEGAGFGSGVALSVFPSGPPAHGALPPPASCPYLPETRCRRRRYLDSPQGRRRSRSPSLPLAHLSVRRHLSPRGRDSG